MGFALQSNETLVQGEGWVCPYKCGVGRELRAVIRHHDMVIDAVLYSTVALNNDVHLNPLIAVKGSARGIGAMLLCHHVP